MTEDELLEVMAKAMHDATQDERALMRAINPIAKELMAEKWEDKPEFLKKIALKECRAVLEALKAMGWPGEKP